MSIMAHRYTNVVSVKKNGFNNLKKNKIMGQSAVEWLVKEFGLESHEATVEFAKQMENQQNGYSESDLKRAFNDGYTIGFRTSIFEVNLKQEQCDEWFEEFVKK